MTAQPRPLPLGDFEATYSSLSIHLPNAEEYQQLTQQVFLPPDDLHLDRLDPFSPEYYSRTIELYERVRMRDKGYIPVRDEAPSYTLPADVWSGVVPWSFGDLSMVGEHLHAWGQVFRHLGIGRQGTILEYGPGSGQLLLMLARMGYRACGVDIDAVALSAIHRQAEIMGLTVPTEQALFGEGFGTERFDAIVFYEAFHHALDFMPLLTRLHDRLKPGGRVLLCGEPIVAETEPGVPYPWGPRLDALSLFCIRRFGWMELGFRTSFFLTAAGRTGWNVTHHPFAFGRADLYVLSAAKGDEAQPIRRGRTAPAVDPAAELRRELDTMLRSKSWRLTAPLRATARLISSWL